MDPAEADPAGPGEPVTLVVPAQRRLTDLAADVLGRLPAEQVPTSLRPLARFTPARRRQRGAVQIAAALDGDDEFRGRVADVVVEASPELSGALRAGTSTAASDPVDVAVVAYLLRPPGWPSLVAAATDRWRAQQHHSDTFADERSGLQAEIAQLRAKLKAESARTRAAARDAAAGARERVGQLDKALSARTAALRAAERERDAARAELAEARREAQARESDHDARERRLRARVGELEQDAGAARKDARRDRQADDARLWLLLDTLVEVAAGIRRELALPEPAVRPGDVVAGGRAARHGDGADTLPAAPAARSLDDAGAVLRVLSLPGAHLIVDGYNVTLTGYPDLPLSGQRARLLGSLAALAGRTGAEVTVAFDGRTRPTVQPRTPRGVRVLFSAADQIADDLIRDLVAAEPPGRPLLVATSDGEIVLDVRRAGAFTAGSAVLLDALG